MALKHKQRAADRAIKELYARPVDEHGFVRLVRYMGSDASIVQAARVSYGNGTKKIRDDVKLLSYLWRNKHTSPFESVILQFHMKLPIFIARQMVRHRTARLNEVSGRYSNLDETPIWIPGVDEIRKQSEFNKQSSTGKWYLGGYLGGSEQTSLVNRWRHLMKDCQILYADLIKAGVAREQARAVLPLSLYTEWYWQMDLRNLLHFLELRCSPHAQAEMRNYAKAIEYFAILVAPETMKIVSCSHER